MQKENCNPRSSQKKSTVKKNIGPTLLNVLQLLLQLDNFRMDLIAFHRQIGNFVLGWCAYCHLTIFKVDDIPSMRNDSCSIWCNIELPCENPWTPQTRYAVRMPIANARRKKAGETVSTAEGKRDARKKDVENKQPTDAPSPMAKMIGEPFRMVIMTFSCSSTTTIPYAPTTC